MEDKYKANCTHIEIRSVPNNSENGTIFTEMFLDGHKLKGVRSFELKQCAGEIPVLTVDLNAFDISIDQKVLMYQKSVGNIKDIIFEEEPPRE